VAEFLGDVEALAQRLPAHTHTINLCRDRYCFAVGLAAAMMRNQISLCPASQAAQSLKELEREYQSVYLLLDDGQTCDLESVCISTGNARSQRAPDSLAFDPANIAAITFTSGSTGKPVASPKTWGALARGGTIEAAHFGLSNDGPIVLVGTVPPQHMFGLESTVMMALRGGLIMHGERPFFPADVAAALGAVEAGRVLVTTPVHLRTLLASGIDLPALRLVISATAPLPVDTAREFENRYQVTVREVYGFTEAGMVATRRTVEGARWTLLPGVTMRQAPGRTWVSGGHVVGEVASSDRIVLSDDAHFELRGRDADLVNIAGKRTSIGYLNHQLCAISGVEDGVFFMPDESAEAVTRLIAFVVAPGMSHQQIIEALRQRIDPLFLPRPLHLVDALPRDSNGKLPRSELLRLARGRANAGLDQPVIVHRSIDASHPALPGHFPGDPIVPGAVLLDEIVDALSSELGIGHASSGVTIQSAKFLRPVRAGERMQIRLIPGEGMSTRFVCSVGGDTAVNGSLTLGGSNGR
jgi:acyl-coenzyme A synthetase/AMP-(fatty) acid ligase